MDPVGDVSAFSPKGRTCYSGPVSTPSVRLSEYRRHLRLAAASVIAVRLLVGASACGLLGFAVSSWLLGPMTPVPWLSIGWALVFAAIVGSIAWSIRPWASLRHNGALALVGMREPRLLSPLLSAFELENDRAYSTELVVAQRLKILGDLEAWPPKRLIPWRWLLRPSLLAIILLSALSWLSLQSSRGAAGAYALLHTAHDSIDGLLKGRAVAGTRATLSFPAYMGREPELVQDADHLLVPRGTTVRYSVTPVDQAARVVLELPGGRSVHASDTQDGFQATFIADVEGPIRIQVEAASGQRRIDYRARSLMVQHDELPSVRLLEPESDLVAEAREPILFRYEAADDYGIQELTLLIKLPTGEQQSRPLFMASEAPGNSLDGETTLYLDEFSLAPADAISVWIEAKDSNQIDGPGVSRTQARTLTLASNITRRRQRIVDLEQLLDTLILALAERLENPAPKRLSQATQRFELVSRTDRAVIEQLTDVGDHPGARTVPLLLDMRKRLEELTRRETRSYASKEPFSGRLRHDKKAVAELEKDTLLVADLISQARLNDAAEIALELEQLRREMSSLVAELRRGQTPELKRALTAALDRAERRMQALREQLLQSRRYVPGEFVNAQSVQATKSTDALQDLRQALHGGDLDAAENALSALSETVDAMAQALSRSESTLVEARFGPRERALMEAMDTIRDLEVQQQRLSRQSLRLGNQAARRAAKQMPPLKDQTREELEQRAEALVEELQALPPRVLGPYDQDMRDRAAARLEDYRKVIRGGDLTEALSMIDAANDAVEQLARDLELSATMFRGRDGQTTAAAEQANGAADAAKELREATQDLMPDMSEALTEREQDQMLQQAEEQAATWQAAHELARRLREDVEGVPISNEAAESLESIEKPMARAEGALKRDSPFEASKEQQAAAEQLKRLRDRLQDQSGSGQGGSEQRQSDQSSTPRERVEIPAASSRAEELAWRRRVLDAMRGKAPEGSQQAVRDYYERLLR